MNMYVKDVEINITGIRLISRKECEECRDFVPKTPGMTWWLSTTSFIHEFYCGFVQDDNPYYLSPSDYRGVRPALIYETISDKKLRKTEKINAADYSWTVIADGLALCDEFIGATYFRKDVTAEDYYRYDKSDVKKWLEKWFDKNIELNIKQLYLKTDKGYFDLSVSPEPDYPGIDIEFISNEDKGDMASRPRVLFELEKNKNLRAVIWDNPCSEDYTRKIEF